MLWWHDYPDYISPVEEAAAMGMASWNEARWKYHREMLAAGYTYQTHPGPHYTAPPIVVKPYKYPKGTFVGRLLPGSSPAEEPITQKYTEPSTGTPYREPPMAYVPEQPKASRWLRFLYWLRKKFS